jgi:hypothetical protein
VDEFKLPSESDVGRMFVHAWRIKENSLIISAEIMRLIAATNTNGMRSNNAEGVPTRSIPSNREFSLP